LQYCTPSYHVISAGGGHVNGFILVAYDGPVLLMSAKKGILICTGDGAVSILLDSEGVLGVSVSVKLHSYDVMFRNSLLVAFSTHFLYTRLWHT
jgi:hypothetical protein